MLRIIGIFTFVSIAAGLAPTCGIENEDGSKPVILPVTKETQSAGAVLGEFPLFNVRYTGPMSDPYRRYVRVIHTNPVYSIESTNVFHQFVQTERSQILTGNVPFYCDDGTNVTYTFHIPIKDEDTESPYFNATYYYANITTTGSGGFIIIDAGISVFDEDVDESNAILNLTLSDERFRSSIVPVVNETSFQYKINLAVRDEMNLGQPWITLEVGDDDGKYLSKAMVRINVTSEDPDSINNNANFIRELIYASHYKIKRNSNFIRLPVC